MTHEDDTQGMINHIRYILEHLTDGDINNILIIFKDKRENIDIKDEVLQFFMPVFYHRNKKDIVYELMKHRFYSMIN